MRTPQTYREFLAVRYWPQLDGLRTISILFVMVGHMSDHWWVKFEGSMGVVLFFVISGFLITSLLIREEERRGRVSLTSFYVRRAFRIVPLYALALGVTTILVLVFHLGAGRDGFAERLPYLVTFNGDLVAYGTFVHSWSIGIEEKFYIVWPLLAFSWIALRRRRTSIIAMLIPVVAIGAYIPAVSYIGLYSGIVLGCGVAILMHNPSGYEICRRIATPFAGTALTIIAALSFVLNYWTPGADQVGNAHVVFAVFASLAFPYLVIGRGWLTTIIGWRPLAFVGTRTYGIYLFHPLCIDLVGILIPSGQNDALPALTRLVAAAMVTYLLAEVLYRIYENPLTVMGRRVARRAIKSGPALPVDTGRDLPGSSRTSHFN